MLARYVSALFSALILLSPPSFAISSEPAKEKLRAMTMAVRTLSYSGKLVYQRADVLANLAVLTF